MLTLNSSSINCGIVPLEKQGKERRKEVGLEKTHKPSLLLLLLPLPDRISISKLITFKIQFKPSLPSAHPKPSLLLLPDRISISKLITFKIQFKPSLPSAHPKPSLLLLPDRISISKLITFKIQFRTFIAKCQSNVAFVSWLMRLQG